MLPNVVAEAEAVGAKYQGTVVAIGKFEGVHRGHQMILDRLNEVANEQNLGSVVLTFYNNPLSVINPSICPEPLMSPKQRRESLLHRGVNDVLMIPFTEEFAHESAENFIKTYLVGALNAKHVIVGSDFRFGFKARGNPQLLKEAGAANGFTVEVIDEVTEAEFGRISSSLVRQTLSNGYVAAAKSLLGHPHTVRGVVTHGDARGRELGFPTANLGPAEADAAPEGFIPADGVYAGLVRVDGKEYGAAISVGNNPTFTPAAKSRVESYLLDFNGSLYGKTMEVCFLEWIRGMEVFDGIEALIAQMQADVKQVREVLKGII